MKLLKRSDIPGTRLPGRVIQSAVGQNSMIDSGKMTVGFAHYSDESGPMEPHHHTEETIYVIGADRGWVRYGAKKDQLGEPVPLAAGMVLHFPEWEWHVFEFEPGGHVDIVFMYGQVTNIRPEDNH